MPQVHCDPKIGSKPVAQEADGFDWIAIPDRISIHTRMVKDVYYRTRELRQPADAN